MSADVVAPEALSRSEAPEDDDFASYVWVPMMGIARHPQPILIEDARPPVAKSLGISSSTLHSVLQGGLATGGAIFFAYLASPVSPLASYHNAFALMMMIGLPTASLAAVAFGKRKVR